MRSLGFFQSEYIAEYAKWSAETWGKICPDIPCTMSFCGAHGREENVAPLISSIFRNTPDNFQPTFDIYPRDGHFFHPLKESDITMLLFFLRQVAYYSNSTKKPYWYWTTGNSWGLGQESENKSNISDAVINQIYAVSTALENKGYLKGIAVWNYNIRNQGLYNDPHQTTYNPDEMFEKVSTTLTNLRTIANYTDVTFYSKPEILIHLNSDYSSLFLTDQSDSDKINNYTLLMNKSNYTLTPACLKINIKEHADSMTPGHIYTEKTEKLAIDEITGFNPELEYPGLFKIKLGNIVCYYNVSWKSQIFRKDLSSADNILLHIKLNGQYEEKESTCTVKHHEFVITGTRNNKILKLLLTALGGIIKNIN